jgi:uncharacterized protein YndB with AHSA1/START domain
MNADPTIQHAELVAEVRIAAPPETVWAALTTGIGAWWPHTFHDRPKRIVLEPTIGGRFYEAFDDAGAGALYATVTYVDPGRILRTSGPMGLRGAAMYVKTFQIEPDADGTRVRSTASLMGAVDSEMVDSYRAGGEEVLRALQRHLEAQATHIG